MADYFTHFSCLLDVGCPEKALRAIDFFVELRDEDDQSDEPQFHGFDLLLQDGPKAASCGFATTKAATSRQWSRSSCAWLKRLTSRASGASSIPIHVPVRAWMLLEVVHM